MKRTWLYLICLLAFLPAARAQLFFETFTSSNGLSGNEVLCVYEDHEHFIWVGTRDGLNRFDGRRFEVFRNNPGDTNSLSGNAIIDLVQDSSGVFWIATKDGGLTRYDPQAPAGKQFRQFRHNPHDKNSIATNRLNCLYDWDSDYLLIGAEVYPGIFLNKKDFTFSYWPVSSGYLHPSKALPLPSTDATWIHHIEGVGNKVYVSTLTLGYLFSADKLTGIITPLHKGSADVLSINNFCLADKRIYLCAWNPGLFVQRDTLTLEAAKLAKFNDLFMCVTDLNATYLLAGTRASGLALVNKQSGEVILSQKNMLQPHTLPSNKISCIKKDSRGIIWVGTAAGLCKYDKAVWLFGEREFASPANDFTVLHTHRFSNGQLAVNTSGGMFVSDSENGLFKNVLFNYRGVGLVPDYLLQVSADTFLLGTEIGFYYWNPKSSAVKEPYFKGGDSLFATPLQMGVFQVKKILRDTVHGQEVYWLAVMGYGLSCYRPQDGLFRMYLADKKSPTAIGNNLVRSLTKDKLGNIWVATAGGLFKFIAGAWPQKAIFESFVNEPTNNQSLPNNDVNDIWCDEAGHIWVTMNGAGLAEYDGKKFMSYLPQNPVSSHSFMGMHADHHNRLWILTKNGIEVFDRSKKEFFHLDVNEGGSNTALASTFSNEQGGQISFVARNRIFTFQPDRVGFSLTFPELYLAGFSSFGKSYLQEAKIGLTHLKARERFIDFEVSCRQYTAAQTVRFLYKLEGLDEQWNNSDDGVIKYTNLPWGHFKLLVRVTNPSGQFGGEKVLADFIIATPFYATWWFISLLVLIVIATAYALYRYRINQLLAMQRVRNKIARDLHDDIGSTLGSISFFSEAAKNQLAQSNQTGAEKMLDKIGETSREMIDNMSDIVWSVNPQNDSVKKLLERMRVFAGDLVANSGIVLHFENAGQLEDLKLSMEQRKNVFLIFKETVYNSVKYADCKSITVKTMLRDKQVVLHISDDGKGFDVTNYTAKNGNGLKNMRYRAQEIGAYYSIESTPGKGTTTTLTL